MCTVNVRGHEANFYEKVRPRLRPTPNDLASRPNGPRGLNIPGREGKEREVAWQERKENGRLGRKRRRSTEQEFTTTLLYVVVTLDPDELIEKSFDDVGCSLA